MELSAKVDRIRRVEKAEHEGRAADSHDVRAALLARIRAGEITINQARAKLERIKRGAKAAGMVTRAQATRGEE